MQQPKGFEESGENKVLKLKKSLYGLKQASHEWNKNIHQSLLELGFTATKSDPCIYVRDDEDNEKFYIILYVDDILLLSKQLKTLEDVKCKLLSKYEMHDLGPVGLFISSMEFACRIQCNCHCVASKLQIALDIFGTKYWDTSTLDLFWNWNEKNLSTE
jgi:hypothetical protein